MIATYKLKNSFSLEKF